MKTSMAMVWCEDCLEYHKMFPGVEYPMYWCKDDLRIIKVGMEVTIMSKGRFRGYNQSQ